MNQEHLLERKCFDFAYLLTHLVREVEEEPNTWRMRQLHFAAVKTGVFVRKSLMHDSRREHAHHMFQASVHALESQYWLQLLAINAESGQQMRNALEAIDEIVALLASILKLKNFNPNY